MPDLAGIGRNALEMQQHHEDFETWVGRYRTIGFEAHRCSPGRCRWRQAACGSASCGCWLTAGSATGTAPWLSAVETKLDAMNWPSTLALAAAVGARIGAAPAMTVLFPGPP